MIICNRINSKIKAFIKINNKIRIINSKILVLSLTYKIKIINKIIQDLILDKILFFKIIMETGLISN